MRRQDSLTAEQNAEVWRQVARMETWLAVYDLAGRKGASNVGKVLSYVKQDSAALSASEAGL